VRREIIESLRCPCTGSPFEIEYVLREEPSSIEFGVLRSAAGEFPVISGILRLLPDEWQAPLVRLIREQRPEEALVAALELPYRDRWSAIINRFSCNGWRNGRGLLKRLAWQSKQTLYKKLSKPNVTFEEFAKTTGKPAWERWQTYRFGMPAFLSVHVWSCLAKNHDRVLDFGSGMGQSSFLMKRINPAALMVCADYSFASLYLSKRFVLSDAEYVCLDGDYAMPFVGGYFDLVFSTDTLQYVEGKIGLAREFQRVMSPEGLVVLAHLHNRLSQRETGKSLEPNGYDALFFDMKRRMYPEDKIVADYVTGGALYLDYRYTLEELNQAADGLSLIAARSEAPFCSYTGLWDRHIDSMVMPRINPVYRLAEGGPGWVIQRGIGIPYAAERIMGDCVILPDTCVVGAESLDSEGILALRTGDRKRLYDLVRRFLVLEMPQDYLMTADNRH
jgi:SAM-dependent methyltransferase